MICFKGNLPPQITTEEEREIFQSWNARNRQRLIEGNMRLALHIAKQFDGKMDSDELVAIAMVGLVKAADAFDPDLGVKFSSFSVACIQREILHALRRAKKAYLDISFETVVACGENDNLKIEDTLYDLKSEKYFQEIEDGQTIYNIIENARITDKERMILKWYVEGKLQKDIAENLGQTQANVSRILKRIFKKIREGEMR